MPYLLAFLMTLWGAVTTTLAFSVVMLPPTMKTTTTTTSSTFLCMSGSTTTKSGLSMGFVRRKIADLDSGSFDNTLREVEPFLVQDAGQSFLTKSLRRIQTAAKDLKQPVPAGYASDAKALAKRKEKQQAYMASKAEAAAAEAAAAAQQEEAAPEDGAEASTAE